MNKWLTGYTLLNLNKAKSSDTEVPLWDINLSISNGTMSTKNYDEREEFDFSITIVIFTFLDGDSLSIPRMKCIYTVSKVKTRQSIYVDNIVKHTLLGLIHVICIKLDVMVLTYNKTCTSLPFSLRTNGVIIPLW